MADNDYEAALERVEAIRNPGRKALAARQRILYVLASQSMVSGDYGKADSYLAKAEAIAGADDALAAEVTLLQAQSMAAKGRYKEAAEKYRAYITATRGRGVNDAVAKRFLPQTISTERKKLFRRFRAIRASISASVPTCSTALRI